MPHAILDCALSLDEIAARFEPVSHTGSHRVVRFIAVYRGEAPPQLLVDVYVEEEPLSQRVAVMIRSREGVRLDEPAGAIIIGLHDLGFPRPTPGLHAAIYYLVSWLQTISPEIHLTSTNMQFEANP